MDPKKWVKIWVFMVICLFFIVSCINFIIDPFLYYRKPNRDIIFNSGEARFLNQGLIRHFDFNSIMIGSSMTQNFKKSELEKLLTPPTLQLPVPGMGSKEGNAQMSLALSLNKKLKDILIGLDIFALRDNVHGGYDMPFYLYDDYLFNDTNYLFSYYITKNSIKTIFNKIKGNTDIETMYGWQKEQSVFSRELAINSFYNNDEREIIKIRRFSDTENLIKNFKDNYLHTIKKNPNINFTIFFPPYSILYFKKLQKYNTLNAFLSVKKYVINELKSCKNVKLFDFQDDLMTITNLDLYKDTIHYSQDINSYMIDMMMKDKFIIKNAKEYDKKIDEFEEFVKNYKVEK